MEVKDKKRPITQALQASREREEYDDQFDRTPTYQEEDPLGSESQLQSSVIEEENLYDDYRLNNPADRMVTQDISSDAYYGGTASTDGIPDSIMEDELITDEEILDLYRDED